jgi:hypothetical protein
VSVGQTAATGESVLWVVIPAQRRFAFKPAQQNFAAVEDGWEVDEERGVSLHLETCNPQAVEQLRQASVVRLEVGERDGFSAVVRRCAVDQSCPKLDQLVGDREDTRKFLAGRIEREQTAHGTDVTRVCPAPSRAWRRRAGGSKWV